MVSFARPRLDFRIRRAPIVIYGAVSPRYSRIRVEALYLHLDGSIEHVELTEPFAQLLADDLLSSVSAQPGLTSEPTNQQNDEPAGAANRARPGAVLRTVITSDQAHKRPSRIYWGAVCTTFVWCTWRGRLHTRPGRRNDYLISRIHGECRVVAHQGMIGIGMVRMNWLSRTFLRPSRTPAVDGGRLAWRLRHRRVGGYRHPSAREPSWVSSSSSRCTRC